MTDENENARLADLKEDFKDTKLYVKELTKSMSLVEKSIIRSEAAQEKILDILINNKIVLEDSSRRLIATEILANNLKTATNGLKTKTNELSKDIETVDTKITERLDAMNTEITTIKELPYKNYVRMKWIFYTSMAGGAYAAATILWNKVLRGLFE